MLACGLATEMGIERDRRIIGGMTEGHDQPQPPPSPMSDADRKNWAMAAHISAFVIFIGVPSLVGPLVVWLIKKDTDAYIAAHSVHALNFNISVLIYTIVGSIAVGIIGLLTLGIGFLLAIPVVIVAFIVWLVLVIQGGLAASRGEQFRYPLTIDFVK
jgi:hypothetical protein